MTSILSGYWSPTHDQGPYLDYYRKLQPADILILQPDVQQISDAHQASPQSTITLRRWDWDDNRGEGNPGIYPFLQSDPEGYARWLVDQYATWIPQLEQQARERGIPFPAREQLLAHHVNEPDTNYLMPQINRTTVLAAQLFRERLDMGCDMLNIGTGQPALLNSHGEPDWSLLNEALDACVRYDHPAVTHEYFNDVPMTDPSIYPWHIGRHAKWAPRGPRWKIGEFGLEMLVNNRRNGHHGWDGIVSQDEIIARTALYLDSLRDDVEAARWYMDDYADRTWRTFNSAPIHAQLIELGRRHPSKAQAAANGHSVHVPIVGGPQPPPVQPGKPANLAHPIADPAMRVLSQRFGANAAAYAPLGVKGHTGVDYAVPIGTPVRAVDTGTALEALEDEDGWGKYVKLGHTWGQSLYAHLNRQDVQFGQIVQRGQVVGLSGNTGNSTGPHLHLGIRLNPIRRGTSDPAGMDGWTNPLPYLQDAATSIWGIIQEAATEYSVDRYLLASLLWAESSWRPDAVSSRGAKGLGQLMPATWAEWSAVVGASNPFDAKDNARVTAAYLGWLTRTLGNNTLKALHAYVWGIGRVMAGNTPPPDVVEYGTKILHGRDLLRAILG